VVQKGTATDIATPRTREKKSRDSRGFSDNLIDV